MTDDTTTETPDEAARLTADAVVVAPDKNGVDHVLLICRRWAPFAGHWALPGGHVDAGETAAIAAARELAEETGVVVPPASLAEVGVWHDPGRDPRGRYVTVAYRAEVGECAEVAARDDATEARWWPVDALVDLDLAFDHADILDAALRQD